jgi:hypothetical protein
LKQHIFLKIKNPRKISVSEIFNRNVIFYLPLTIRLTQAFILQIFRAADQAPPFPLPPTGLCNACGGGIVAVFILKPQLSLWLPSSED